MPGVTLVGVADPDAARAAEVAAAHGTQAFADASALPPVDAVVVAAPTELHAELAGPFLSRGVSVLVEKPVTRTLEEADGLIALAARHGAVLAVGHSERFNPAVAAALPHVKAPGFVEVHRLSGFRERSLDIDVVFDLMIHDLDVLLAAIGTEVTAIEAVGVPVLSPRIDIANVRLTFASGCIANLTASRISFDTIRKVRFFQPRAYIGIDFAKKEAELYQVVRGRRRGGHRRRQAGRGRRRAAAARAGGLRRRRAHAPAAARQRRRRPPRAGAGASHHVPHGRRDLSGGPSR